MTGRELYRHVFKHGHFGPFDRKSEKGYGSCLVTLLKNYVDINIFLRVFSNPVYAKVLPELYLVDRLE